MRPASEIANYVTMGINIIGIALTGVALFTDYWVEIVVANQNGPLGSLHRGLMQWVCINPVSISNNNCIAKYPVFPNWLKSVFWCMVVSFALQIILVLFGVLSMLTKSKRIYLVSFCSFLAMISFVLMTIAIGLFAGKSNKLYFETQVYKNYTVWCQLGWSYWLAILAVVFSIVSTVLEGIQIFAVMRNIGISYPYPPEAITTWKFTM